ncbi:VOC family protein [Hydrogenophaga sp. OTU3427]|uniref:VOC family protein n=1 Tax=Hydrogenophaga sp. OTU3427 TaxID=3043856 RepID=UPI00313D6547
MNTTSLDFSHVGIHVYDMDAMVGFYQRVLGLVVTDRGNLPGRELTFMSRNPREHHQVVLASGRTGAREDKVINQISFRASSLEELQKLYTWVRNEPQASGFRTINHGNAWTLYFHDPEGNRLEVFVDSPWYVAQPCSEPLNLDTSADAIREQTEALCRRDPSFELAEVWRTKLASRIESGIRNI